MADIGHELTDDFLKELEKRIKEEYDKAVSDMERKYVAWFKKFTQEDENQKSLLEEGKITEQDYKDWRFRHLMIGKRWEQMLNVLAGDLQRADRIARRISLNSMPDVYALNVNYSTYQIENGGGIDTGFTLYNHDAAEKMIRETELQLMPGPSASKAAQLEDADRWDRQKITSAVLQGVLQGESAYEIAHRLEIVGQMKYNAAVRYARTMTTNAQNAGRYEAYRRADRLGVDLTIEWQATLDGRTRHDHRLMHGQRTSVDEPFHTPDGFTIMWPADCTSNVSTAPQSEVWNCRCTLLSWVKGFEGDTVKENPHMRGLSFEEWLEEKPHAWTAEDRAQYYRYKELLRGKAPTSLYQFREIKRDSAKWEELKQAAKEARKK